MTGKIIIRLFLCLVVAQLVIPAAMILQRETILKQGAQFKFKTAPVDPYDAFRGRYVALRLAESIAPVGKGTELRTGQTVYALIAVDEKGFAKFSGASLTPPQNTPYLRANIGYAYPDKIVLVLPFNRYYMEESAALKAEKIYRQRARGAKDAYVLVRIKDGSAVIESLYIGGMRVEDAVRRGL